MSSDPAFHSATLERLSALVDGELDDAAVARACAQWREDAGVRSSWHEYQLIGDVLRSEDLAIGIGREAAFLGALHVKLCDEPVVLAPQARPGLSAPSRPATARHASGARDDRSALGGRWSWIASSVVAAGFVGIAGVLIVMRGPGTPAVAESGPALAKARTVVPVQGAGVGPGLAVAATEPEVSALDGRMIRDARLDRYLAAHKQFAGSSALGVPSAFLRSATADASNR